MAKGQVVLDCPRINEVIYLSISSLFPSFLSPLFPSSSFIHDTDIYIVSYEAILPKMLTRALKYFRITKHKTQVTCFKNRKQLTFRDATTGFPAK